MTALAIELDEDGAGARLTLAGELDIASAPSLAEAIRRELDAGRPSLVVDLRGLEFIDSSGLRALIVADADARERGRRLLIVRAAPRVHRTFEMTRLDEYLTMLDAPPAAP